jgi:hypothetical protein
MRTSVLGLDLVSWKKLPPFSPDRPHLTVPRYSNETGALSPFAAGRDAHIPQVPAQRVNMNLKGVSPTTGGTLSTP